MKTNRLFYPLLIFSMLLLIGVFQVPASVHAADSGYPSQPITWVVPYGPGGGFDTIARAVAPIMKE